MKCHRGIKVLALAAAGFAFSASAGAQSTTSTTDPTVGQRKENQQDRIANGVQNGSLTPGETTNLEGKEANLNKETRQMRSADDGHLTAADKAKLNTQQNRLSNNIYQDKHNAASDHFGSGSVGQRKENQQDRIAQGVRSGQLTAGETHNLEAKQTALNGETRNMRNLNNGKLTAGDKKVVNAQQNRLSRNIYRDKHNGRRQ
jgi:hypothetical protein